MTLKCTSLFVEPELQSQGYGIALLAQAVLQTGTTEYQSFVFDVSPVHPEMVRFVYRRMASYLVSLRTSKATSKQLIHSRASVVQ
jgi:GNAT superfamily N-acetyltransferase